MLQLNPNYVTDNNNKKIAVQLNIQTYNKIEEVLENYGLRQLMEEDNDAPLELKEAQLFYEQLKKKK